MRLQHKQTHGICWIAIQDLFEGKEVAQALRHLLAIDLEHTRVHPHTSERLVPGATRLSSLVFVVREGKVSPAAVDVDWGAKVAMDHRAALGVPTWASLSPGAWPARLAWLCSLPQGKVERVALVLVLLDARTNTQIVDIDARDSTVVGAATHCKVDVAIGGSVGVSLLDEARDHLLHGLDFLRCPWTNIGIENAKAAHLLDKGIGELLRHLLGGATLLVGTVDDLVVDVGEVLGKRHLVALIDEVATDNVKRKKRTRIAHVNLVVDSRAAHIHADLARLEGLELLLAMELVVVDEHGKLLIRM